MGAGPAAAAGLACNPHDKFRVSGSNTPEVHMFFYYACNQDPASTGATDIQEAMYFVTLPGQQLSGLASVDRGTKGSAATELTVCSGSGAQCDFFRVPGRYQAIEELLIFGNVANGDAHCGRDTGLPGNPIHCTFFGPTFNLT